MTIRRPRPVKDGFRSGGPSPTYSAGLLWLASNDPHKDLVGLRYSNGIILLAHLFDKPTSEVAADVFNMRKGG